VSNASDALEKCRHDYLARGEDPGELAVAIKVDNDKGTFIIEDNGLGMSREDLTSNLGTIARSGSKAFVDELSSDEDKNTKDKNKSATNTAAANIIGKFGVGFYSAFMVSDSVDVFSCVGDGKGHKWSSKGDGSYTIAPCYGRRRARPGPPHAAHASRCTSRSRTKPWRRRSGRLNPC
jgi:TNF receptor-associated protein 1